jgi:hypothetical protein
MRLAYLALVLFACKKAEPPPTVTPPTVIHDAAIADAMTADAQGAAQIVDVELVQLTAAEVRVSSTVANPNIRPTHLVDKNMSTAWNSVTGQLVGAWIDIEPIFGAEVHQIRLTPGFTAKGPKGEDWFTMNPRIRRLSVLADGNPQPDIYLNVTKRELQAFPVIARDRIRLEVLEIVPGTKKQWREISISELEAWGSTPPGWTSPKPLPSIVVHVGEVVETDYDPCKGIEERQEAVRREGLAHRDNCTTLTGCDDHNYPPICSLGTATVVGSPLAPPWETYTVWCESNDEIYGPSGCHVRFTRGTDETFAHSLESPHGEPSITTELEMTEVLVASPGPELVVTHTNGEQVGVSICRADTFTCSVAIEVPEGAALSAQKWVFK